MPFFLITICFSYALVWDVICDQYSTLQGSPLPMLLDDEMASLMDIGIGNESTILVDEES